MRKREGLKWWDLVYKTEQQGRSNNSHFNPSLSWKPQPKKVTKEVKNELKREDMISFSCCVGCPLVCCVLNLIDHYLLMFIWPLPYLEGEGHDSCEWFLSLRVVLCIQYPIAHYRCLSAFSLINVLSKNRILMMRRTRWGEGFEASQFDHKVCSCCFLCS